MSIYLSPPLSFIYPAYLTSRPFPSASYLLHPRLSSSPPPTFPNAPPSPPTLSRSFQSSQRCISNFPPIISMSSKDNAIAQSTAWKTCLGNLLLANQVLPLGGDGALTFFCAGGGRPFHHISIAHKSTGMFQFGTYRRGKAVLLAFLMAP